MASGNKHERREARIRGSGTQSIKVEDFNIASPETPKQAKLLQSLESALTKPEDRDLPRLRQSKHSILPPPAARPVLSDLRQEKRKTSFSSDDDEEGEEHGADRLLKVSPQSKDFPEMDLMDSNESGWSNKEELSAEEPSLVKREQSEEEEPDKPIKRRRGRPKKGEVEKKTQTVTRRSKRIVDNPHFKRTVISDKRSQSSAPKPLRVLGLTSLAPQITRGEGHGGAISLTKAPSGKQKPVMIEAERFYTASTRDRRFNLTTLDVLKQFVEDFAPRPGSNEVVNENVVLTEFKAHLQYYITHLMDLHSSIIDISHDISEVQKKKLELRKKILDLKKKHAEIGVELAVERKSFAESKAKHQKFMKQVNLFDHLRSCVVDESKRKQDLNSDVSDKLDDITRACNPTTGVQPQLRSINSALARMVNK